MTEDDTPFGSVEVTADKDDDTIRPKLRVKHVLQNIEHKNFTLLDSSTIVDGINHLVSERLSSSLAIDEHGVISGIFTTQDLLNFIDKNHLTHGIRNHSDPLLTTRIYEIMTRKEKLIFCSPTDTIKRCREIMFQCNVSDFCLCDHKAGF